MNDKKTKTCCVWMEENKGERIKMEGKKGKMTIFFHFTYETNTFPVKPSFLGLDQVMQQMRLNSWEVEPQTIPAGGNLILEKIGWRQMLPLLNSSKWKAVRPRWHMLEDDEFTSTDQYMLSQEMNFQWLPMNDHDVEEINLLTLNVEFCLGPLSLFVVGE